MHHPQVVQSTILNDFLKANIGNHTKPNPPPKLLLQMFVRELHYSFVSDSEDGGFKESRYSENNIIIGDSTLRSLLPPKLNKFQHDTRSCVVIIVYIFQKYKLLITIMV